MLAFTLPLGVSVNAMYSISFSGVRLTDAARTFKKNATMIARNAANTQGGWKYPADTPLFLHMRIYFPNNKRADLSNLIKVGEDSIADGVGFDDRYVYRLVVERGGVDPKNPRCEVILAALDEVPL